jgi:hypothetical protein
MSYQSLANMVVFLHLLFILFIICGGLLLLRWPKLIWLHLTAISWGVAIELFGWICPLTPLENWLRQKSFESPTYSTGFVEHYLVPVIYPQALTRELQLLLPPVVIIVNALVYVLVLRIRKKRINS